MPQQHHSATRLFAKPQDILESYLLEDEIILYDDAPSLNAFLIDQLPLLILGVVGAIAAIAWTAHADQPVLTGVILIALGLLLAYLLLQRATQLYTRYVLTTFRVMKMSGFLRRSNAWIPWVKVTDVRYESTLIGRWLGFATLSIDSANELSGLKELKDLRDPARCEMAMVEAVRAKQSGKQIGPATVQSPVAGPAPRPDLAEMSSRLAELLSSGPVTVTITYPQDGASRTGGSHAVVVDDPDDTDFDATRFD